MFFFGLFLPLSLLIRFHPPCAAQAAWEDGAAGPRPGASGGADAIVNLSGLEPVSQQNPSVLVRPELEPLIERPAKASSHVQG